MSIRRQKGKASSLKVRTYPSSACQVCINIMANPNMDRKPKLRWGTKCYFSFGLIETLKHTLNSCSLPIRFMSSTSREVPCFSPTTSSMCVSTAAPWFENTASACLFMTELRKVSCMIMPIDSSEGKALNRRLPKDQKIDWRTRKGRFFSQHKSLGNLHLEPRGYLHTHVGSSTITHAMQQFVQITLYLFVARLPHLTRSIRKSLSNVRLGRCLCESSAYQRRKCRCQHTPPYLGTASFPKDGPHSVPAKTAIMAQFG